MQAGTLEVSGDTHVVVMCSERGRGEPGRECLPTSLSEPRAPGAGSALGRGFSACSVSQHLQPDSISNQVSIAMLQTSAGTAQSFLWDCQPSQASGVLSLQRPQLVELNTPVWHTHPSFSQNLRTPFEVEEGLLYEDYERLEVSSVLSSQRDLVWSARTSADGTVLCSCSDSSRVAKYWDGW